MLLPEVCLVNFIFNEIKTEFNNIDVPLVTLAVLTILECIVNTLSHPHEVILKLLQISIIGFIIPSIIKLLVILNHQLVREGLVLLNRADFKRINLACFLATSDPAWHSVVHFDDSIHPLKEYQSSNFLVFKIVKSFFEELIGCVLLLLVDRVSIN